MHNQWAHLKYLDRPLLLTRIKGFPSRNPPALFLRSVSDEEIFFLTLTPRIVVVVVVIVDGRSFVNDVAVEEATVTLSERHDEGSSLGRFQRFLRRWQLTRKPKKTHFVVIMILFHRAMIKHRSLLASQEQQPQQWALSVKRSVSQGHENTHFSWTYFNWCEQL